MGWFSDLFSPPSTSQNLRKGQAMSSTHEAFSLPTSSPIFPSHPDAFNPDTLTTPDPESARSPTYTYPPQVSPSYGYVPTSRGSRPSSLLPTHHDTLHTPLTSPVSYPPLAKSWSRLRAWLSREYPELGDTLNYGILPQDLAQIEMQFGFALPAVVRESYLIVDGQEAESAAGCSEGLFFGLTLLPLEDVLEEWRFWREVDEDPSTGANAQLRELMGSLPPGWVRREYSQRGWIPLIADKGGNYVGVDLNPDDGGSVGQVIVFGRDFDTKVVLWMGDGPAGWAKWLASFVEELETGDGYEIGSGDSSDGGEDDLGYESYFYDGNGRGQGDGGGDSGSGGGLRLTGDYRGWNVLEAWADRSLRKWYEAGVLPDRISPEEEILQGKTPQSVGLGVHIPPQPGAEVAIPVLAEVDDTISHKAAPPARSNLPTISVTRPPAPLPVSLPTPHDIDASPSPPDSAHSSFEDDLESGRSPGMRDISREPASTTSSRRLPRPQPSDQGSGLYSNNITSLSMRTSATDAERLPSPPPDVPLPVSPNSSTTVVLPVPTAVPVPDLLADSAPALQTVPIEPSPPSPLFRSRTEIPSPSHPEPKSESKSEPMTDGSNAEADEEPDPDVTIRLVGGGGTAGMVDGVEQKQEEEDEEEDADSVSVSGSVTSESSQKQDAEEQKQHKRSKSSLAGLKKLGVPFGGLRKKEEKQKQGVKLSS